MEILKEFDYKRAETIGGYTDRILKIDLGKHNIEIIELPPEFKNKYLGGRGYAIKLIWDGTGNETGYDSPENILVMSNGPLGNEPGFPGSFFYIS